MFYAGPPAPNGLMPRALIGPYQGFLVLVGVAFVLGTAGPSTVGGYARSLEGVHGGRLFLYALAVLVGVLGLQVGEELGGPPWSRKPLWSRIGQISALGVVALGALAPFLVVYGAWVAAPWDRLVATFAYLAVLLAFWLVVGVWSAVRVLSDERRFFVKYLVLALVSFAPLLAPLPLSPLAAVVAIWEGKSAGSVAGWVLPTTAGLVALGWSVCKVRRSSSAGPGDGAGRDVRHEPQ